MKKIFLLTLLTLVLAACDSKKEGSVVNANACEGHEVVTDSFDSSLILLNDDCTGRMIGCSVPFNFTISEKDHATDDTKINHFIHAIFNISPDDIPIDCAAPSGFSCVQTDNENSFMVTCIETVDK